MTRCSSSAANDVNIFGTQNKIIKHTIMILFNISVTNLLFQTWRHGVKRSKRGKNLKNKTKVTNMAGKQERSF